MVQSLQRLQLFLIIACLLLASSCTALSNCNYAQQFQHYGGIRRIAVFVQHWPVYLQLRGQDDLGSYAIISEKVTTSG